MPVAYITIAFDHTGQRIDNYLVTLLKGVPKSRIYRALRKGEIRVNKKRVKADYRLQAGDQLRLPPLTTSEVKTPPQPSRRLLEELEKRILLEDEFLMIVDKPADMPVHGGSGIIMSLINAVRAMRPECRFIELVHRLDRGTSGCVVIAKKRQILLECHHLLTSKKMQKQYLALVKGTWTKGERRVEMPLLKNISVSGERKVIVSDQGKPAKTIFRPLQCFDHATLLEVVPITGRTHQIRVHAAAIGHPIAGDQKYGDREFNRSMETYGIHRLFLHSAGILFRLPQQQRTVGVCAPLEKRLCQALLNLGKG